MVRGELPNSPGRSCDDGVADDARTILNGKRQHRTGLILVESGCVDQDSAVSCRAVG